LFANRFRADKLGGGTVSGVEDTILDAIVRTPQTVLVVEDDWLVRSSIAEYLHKAGFTVLEAHNGEAAFEVLEHGDPVDIVFTDIRLRGEHSGWDVAEAFRVRRPGVYIIYTSGHTIVPPREVSGSMYFNKPYRPEDILRACRTCGPAVS
jgi:CheY-like chemotaxis protein